MSGVSRTGPQSGRRGASDRLLDSRPGELSETDPEHPRRFGRLAPGDRVVVIAPSGPVDPVRLEKGCDILRELGLRVTVAAHALDDTALAEGGSPRADWQRVAGGDADRAADLTAAWCDPDVRGVLCARGGYGATRVLDHLDWGLLASGRAARGGAPRDLRNGSAAASGGTAPKVLHGSSDVTALHVAFGERLGITTSFGPMVAGEPFTEGTDGGTADGDGHRRSLEHFRALLFGPENAAEGRADTKVTGTRSLRSGTAEGLLAGGTLAVLAALMGTSAEPPPAAGRIVFLEDVAEAPYRVDRMLTQLLQAGWFDGAAGIALGSWRGCGDQAELDAVFAGRLGPLGVPILAGLPVGHGPRQLTLELGAPYRLDTHARTLDASPGGMR